MATTTRTGGFSSVDVGALNAGLQTLLLGSMYVSVLPVVVAVRYSDETWQASPPPPTEQRRASVTAPWGRRRASRDARLQVGDAEAQWPLQVPSDVRRGGNSLRSQAKGFLTQHALWIFVVWVAVCIIEAPQILSDPSFTTFAVLFEIVSAYGCVGLSVGYPGVPASFSAVWAPLAKVFLLTVMFLGRLRGLPFSIDRAVRVLPPTLRTSHTAVRLSVHGGPADAAPARTYDIRSELRDEFGEGDQLPVLIAWRRSPPRSGEPDDR